MLPKMNDDVIIQQRISGRSMRAIAKAQATTVAEVNKALDRFTETTIDGKVRNQLKRADQRRQIFEIKASGHHATKTDLAFTSFFLSLWLALPDVTSFAPYGSLPNYDFFPVKWLALAGISHSQARYRSA